MNRGKIWSLVTQFIYLTRDITHIRVSHVVRHSGTLWTRASSFSLILTEIYGGYWARLPSVVHDNIWITPLVHTRTHTHTHTHKSLCREETEGISIQRHTALGWACSHWFSYIWTETYYHVYMHIVLWFSLSPQNGSEKRKYPSSHGLKMIGPDNAGRY